MTRSATQISSDSLEGEMIATLTNAHTELLQAFSRSAPNALRGKIRSFRDLLQRLSAWATSHGYDDLAVKATWWEWYWYEREYGDSKFDPIDDDSPITIASDDTLATISASATLLNTIITDTDLGQEIGEAAVLGSNRPISILDNITGPEVWQVLDHALDLTGPIQRRLASELLVQAVRRTNLSNADPMFLALLAKFQKFRVELSRGWSNIAVLIEDERGITQCIGAGPMADETTIWLVDESVRRESAVGIAAFAREMLNETL